MVVVRRIKMFRPRIAILMRLGTIILILYILWIAWQHLGPRKPEVGPLRRELADRLVPTIVEDLRISRQSLHNVALIHFENDPTDYITNRLRLVIEQNGTFDLRDRTVSEKLFDVLKLRHLSYGAADIAVARGRALVADGVIFGTVGTFESYPGGAKLELEVNLVDVPSSDVVFSHVYSTDTPSIAMVAASVKQELGRFHWFQRLFSWLIIVLLLPVFTISFIRAMIRKESNKTNAFVLAIYTVADALLAYLLVGAALSSFFAIIVFIIAVAAAFAYNIRVMTFALRLET